jgi:hypothetical protein
MRASAFAFVIEHWEFFAAFAAVGVTGAALITLSKRAAAARRAKEEAAASRALDAEMAEIRKNLPSA